MLFREQIAQPQGHRTRAFDLRQLLSFHAHVAHGAQLQVAIREHKGALKIRQEIRSTFTSRQLLNQFFNTKELATCLVTGLGPRSRRNIDRIGVTITDRWPAVIAGTVIE